MIILILLYGLKLAGIDTVVLQTTEEILSKLEEIKKDASIGILGVTNKIYELVEKEIKGRTNK